MDVSGQDIVVAEEANPFEVAPEGVLRQFSESLAHNVATTESELVQPLLGSGSALQTE